MFLKLPAIWRGESVIPGTRDALRSERGTAFPHVALLLGRSILPGLVLVPVALACAWAFTLPEHLVVLRTTRWNEFLQDLKVIVEPVLLTSSAVMLLVSWTGRPEWLIAPPYRRLPRGRRSVKW
jgi:hypothetical protein